MHKATLLQAMAALIGLPAESAQGILRGCPSVATHAGVLQIGRVNIKGGATASSASRFRAIATASTTASQFAMTAHARHVMESVAAAVKMSEPLLLVGESGTGKTASIQYLAEQVRSSKRSAIKTIQGLCRMALSVLRTVHAICCSTYPDISVCVILTRVWSHD